MPPLGAKLLELTRPLFLLLLPLPAWLFVRLLRGPRPAATFSDIRMFDGLPVGRATRVRWMSALMRSLAVLAVVVALAGPRLPDRDGGYRLPTEGVALSFVLDTSGSMGKDDFEWKNGEPSISRIEAAKRALRLFIAGGTSPDGEHFAGRPTDLVGLVTFASWPDPVVPLTLSHAVLLQILDTFKPADELSAGSNVGDAVTQGVIQLDAAPGRRKVLVLFSDGEHNFDLEPPRRPNKPRQAAQLAAARGILIYAIDTGGEPASDGGEQRKDGRRVLQSVVDLTGGRMFTANNSRELLDACRFIDALERDEIVSFTYRRYVDLDGWLGGTALALWLAVHFLERGPWRRLP